MTTLTMLTSASATSVTTSTTFKDDGTIDTDKRNSIIGVAAATAGTLVGASLLEAKTMDDIYERYSSAYVDSLSDEELARALEQLDLMEASISENTTKTI